MDEANNHRKDASQWVAETQHSDFRFDPGARARLHAWLVESESHSAAFASAQRTFHRLRSRVAYSGINLGALILTHCRLQVRARHRARGKRWMAAAAALTVGLFLPLLPQQLAAAPTFYTTRVGEQRTLTLDDGSQITLSSGTKILVQEAGRYREIDLIRGETFFNMVEHPRRPIRVFSSLGMVAGPARAFDVLQTERELRVATVRGELSVLTIDPARAALAQQVVGSQDRNPFKHTSLRTGDIVTLRVSSYAVQINVEAHTPLDIERLIAWREGILAFGNETAQTVVESFNRYNRQQFAIVDSGIAALRSSGDFKLNDPKSFVLALQRIYPDSKIIAERDSASGALQLRRRTATESRSGRITR
jgi:ferric-dicitrate binding protein FerR (iron transport regulator)